jgi:hypothetical protein
MTAAAEDRVLVLAGGTGSTEPFKRVLASLRRELLPR